MVTFPQFQQLAPELQAEVSACLPTEDLLSLNLASRRLHALTIHQVLRRVDLDLVIESPATASWPYQVDNSYELRANQRKLIHTLAQNPEYAAYIRDLSWHIFSDAGVPLEFFRTLDQVEAIRLNVSRGDMAGSLDEAGAMFPRLTTVTLAGQVTPQLANMTLHSPSRLHELVLDHIYSPEPDFLLRLLDVLKGQCPVLERLALRRPGNSRSDEPFNVAAEETTLVAFASFANSCRATLTDLEFALTPLSHGIVFFGHDNRPSHVRAWLLPAVFAPALGTWPLLRRLKLGGIALNSVDMSGISQAAPGVMVDLALDADAPGEYPMPTDHSNFATTKFCG